MTVIYKGVRNDWESYENDFLLNDKHKQASLVKNNKYNHGNVIQQMHGAASCLDNSLFPDGHVNGTVHLRTEMAGYA